MAMTLIRTAGPYSITTDGRYFYCNGVSTACDVAPAGSPFVLVVDTKRIGSNGQRDMVGLTAEHRDLYRAACTEASVQAARQPINVRRGLVDGINAIHEQMDDEREAAIDRLVATGKTRIAPDRSAALAHARQSLADFDAAHPEVRAQAERLAEAQEAERAQAADHFLAHD